MIGTVLLVAVMAISLYGFSEASAQATAVTAGIVFSDVNKNAVRDAGEAGLADINVLCVPHFQSSAPIWATTDDSGQYRFETQAGCYLTQASVPDWVAGDPDVHAYTAAHEGRTVTLNFASWQTNLCESDYVLVGEQCLGSQSELDPIIGTLAELQQLVEDLLDRITVLEASPGENIQCPTGQIPVDGICMDIICPAGYELDGNHCIQIYCDTGYVLDYDTNTCEFAGCPTGHLLRDNECIFDTSDEAQPYIATDRTVYTLGDMVHVNGKLHESFTSKQFLNGTTLTPYQTKSFFTIYESDSSNRFYDRPSIIPIDGLAFLDSNRCVATYLYDQERFDSQDWTNEITEYGSAPEHGKWYRYSSYYENGDWVSAREECNITKNGIFFGSFQIVENLPVGEYYIYADQQQCVLDYPCKWRSLNAFFEIRVLGNMTESVQSEVTIMPGLEFEGVASAAPVG